jgi:hypothetical protein
MFLGIRALDDHALPGAAAHLEHALAEVLELAAQGKQLPHPEAAVAQHPDHRLVPARRRGEGVHLLPGQDPRPPRRTAGARVAPAHPRALERVRADHLVGDRVLGHGGQGSEFYSRMSTFGFVSRLASL